METIKRSFDPKQVLPENLIIKSAATHLYTAGLSLFPYDFVKRNRYHNPLLVFILNLQLFIRIIVSLLLLSDENKYMLMVLGEWAHFFNVRIHFNILASPVILIAIVSQIIHYYNFKNNIKPSYLKPFEMISGLCSPKSIGLTNQTEIYKMIKLSKKLFILLNITYKIQTVSHVFIIIVKKAFTE